MFLARWLPLASPSLAIKAGFLIQIFSDQKGDYPMLKIAVRYTRYVLSTLATVGFALSGN